MLEDINLISKFAQILSPLILLCTAALAIFTYRNSIQEVSPAAKIANMKEYFVNSYSDRNFEKIFATNPGQSTKIPISSIIELRSFLSQNYHENIEPFRTATTTEGSSENKLAHQLSIGLQQAGHMVISGGLPFWTVMGGHGEAVIEDWIACSDFVASIRRKYGEFDKNVPGAQYINFVGTKTQLKRPEDYYPFRRRHGEWLAFVAVLYIWSRSGPIASVRNFRRYCAPEMKDDEFDGWLRDQVALIMKNDRQLVARSVKKCVRKISKMKRAEFCLCEEAVEKHETESSPTQSG